jgi:pantoate--beta-alanine ligase
MQNASSSSLQSYFASLLASRRPGALPVVARSVAEVRALRAAMDALARAAGAPAARVGFVPTMGALHAGHLDLVRLARADRGGGGGGGGGGRSGRAPAHFVLASIFVNPTQFAPHEDLSRYPRTLDSDLAALAARGCDAAFVPRARDMYPPGAAFAPFRTFVAPAEADARTPEGGARPGFFRGVATVVLKLLNCVAPTHAVFGQKDGVQCLVVRQMARDLNLRVRVDVAPTTREADGLAMSSRNAYLSAEQRAAAPAIFRALERARRDFRDSAEARELQAAIAERQRDRRRRRREVGESDGDGGGGDDAATAVAAQQAAVSASRGGREAEEGSGTAAAAAAAAALEPALARAAESVRADVAREGGGLLRAPQYLAFSDALSGRDVLRAADSTARNGAVMMSVAVPVGSLRLLDNVMLLGDPADLGADPDADEDDGDEDDTRGGAD